MQFMQGVHNHVPFTTPSSHPAAARPAVRAFGRIAIYQIANERVGWASPTFGLSVVGTAHPTGFK